MKELTPEQQAARAIGMSKGVPEEFAIDCKGIALGNITIGKVTFQKGDKEVHLYDIRHRDYLRSNRLFMPTHDVFLVTRKPEPATIPSVTVNTEDDHGRNDESNSNPPSDAGQSDSGALHESGGAEPQASPNPATRIRRATRRSGTRR